MSKNEYKLNTSNTHVSECSKSFFDLTKIDKSNYKPRVLLHSCCGPCSTAVIERLFGDYEITVFYYNPCITETDEYEKRKFAQIKFIDEFNNKPDVQEKVRYIEGKYNPLSYLKMVEGLEDEPEGGKRCTLCFEQRLGETARMAKSLGFDFFTTTLTVSPHKNFSLISSIGKKFEKRYEISFLDLDFKKKAGFQRSIQLSKEHKLYRQDYCGCRFSKR
ncbi:MAG: epoxyqueuosine reductase QueH [Eubacterium sp.]|nr:epoxyqueuosine reductase QueH [Eubacterium sp.]